MRYINLILVALLILFISCNKEDNLHSDYGKLVIQKGDSQSGYFGEMLKDTIFIKASSSGKNRSYVIRWEMIMGNGNIHVSNEYSSFGNNGNYINSDQGKFKIIWELGCNSDIQKLRILLFMDSIEYGNSNLFFREPSDSIIVTATGVKPKGWAKSCGCENFDKYASKIFTYDNKTLYLVSKGLYSSVDNGINWEKVEGIPVWDIADAQFNSKGWLYILTKNNGMCYSKDLQHWTYINNGILDYRNPTAFYTEDTAIFVSFSFDGPYKTVNNGTFWRKLLVSSDGEEEYYSIIRHPNGDIYLNDKWNAIWISKDNGKIWNKASIDYKYRTGRISDLKIDKKGLIYIGGEDATLSIIDPETYQGEKHQYYEGVSSSQNVTNIQFRDDNVFFQVKGNPKSGLYSKANNWSLLNLGFTKSINNYYIRPDNSFIFFSYDGLYYYSKE